MQIAENGKSQHSLRSSAKGKRRVRDKKSKDNREWGLSMFQIDTLSEVATLYYGVVTVILQRYGNLFTCRATW